MSVWWRPNLLKWYWAGRYEKGRLDKELAQPGNPNTAQYTHWEGNQIYSILMMILYQSNPEEYKVKQQI
jgi:hypothetical protein